MEESDTFRVVINDEEQYSIWPARRTCPPGWHDAGKQGTRVECLEYIREVWTDMRPRSVREALAGSLELGERSTS